MSFNFSSFLFECFESSLFEFCSFFKKLDPRVSPAVPKRALIFISDSLGDTLIALPPIADWIQRHPETKVAFVCGTQAGRDCLSLSGIPGAVIAIDALKEARLKKKTSLSLLNKAIKELRAFNPDLCFLTHQSRFPYYQCLAVLSGVPWIIGIFRQGADKKSLLDQTILISKTDSVAESGRTLFNSDARHLKEGGLAPVIQARTKRIRITLHPGTKQIWKKWPVENWCSLIKKLLEKDNVQVQLPDSSFENEIVSQILESLDKDQAEQIKLVQAESIADLTTLIKESSLLVCIDSGAMHIAGLLKVSFVALFFHKYSFDCWRPAWEEGATLLISTKAFPGTYPKEAPSASECVSIEDCFKKIKKRLLMA